MSVRDTDKGYREAVEALRKMAGRTRCVAGIRAAKGGQVYQDPDGGGSITLAEIAGVHEFGSKKAGVPERSFLRSTFDRKKTVYQGLLRRVLEDAIDGKLSLEDGLDRLGVLYVGDVQEYIRAGSGPPPPLAPATIKAKGSSHALIDTGRMVNSIDSEVRKE